MKKAPIELTEHQIEKMLENQQLVTPEEALEIVRESGGSVSKFLSASRNGEIQIFHRKQQCHKGVGNRKAR